MNAPDSANVLKAYVAIVLVAACIGAAVTHIVRDVACDLAPFQSCATDSECECRQGADK